MDTTTLVTNRIDDGRRLLARLANRGVDVAVAGWLETGDEGRRYLYIATGMVDEVGPAKSYSAVYAALDAIRPHTISDSDIKLIGPNHLIARDLLSVRRDDLGSNSTGGRFEVGPSLVEDSYIYPSIRPGTLTLLQGKRRLRSDVQQELQLDRMLAPLTTLEEQALNQIVESGVSRAQAEYWVRQRRKWEWENPPILAGTVVTASVAAHWGSDPSDDPNPLLLVESPDGARGLTFANNTEPV